MSLHSGLRDSRRSGGGWKTSSHNGQSRWHSACVINLSVAALRRRAGGEAGINDHDILPITTPRNKQMMPPADRIYDPSQGAKKDLIDTGDDFLAIGLALRNHATKCRRFVSSQAWSHFSHKRLFYIYLCLILVAILMQIGFLPVKKNGFYR